MIFRDVIMAGTAYIGSYMVCKSLAAFIGNEREIERIFIFQ